MFSKNKFVSNGFYVINKFIYNSRIKNLIIN